MKSPEREAATVGVFQGAENPLQVLLCPILSSDLLFFFIFLVTSTSKYAWRLTDDDKTAIARIA